MTRTSFFRIILRYVHGSPLIPPCNNSYIYALIPCCLSSPSIPPAPHNGRSMVAKRAHSSHRELSLYNSKWLRQRTKNKQETTNSTQKTQNGRYAGGFNPTSVLLQSYVRHTAALLPPYFSPTSALLQPHCNSTSALPQPYFSHTSALLQPYVSPTSDLLPPYFSPTSTLFQPYLRLALLQPYSGPTSAQFQ